jgi:hypothetical protein
MNRHVLLTVHSIYTLYVNNGAKGILHVLAEQHTCSHQTQTLTLTMCIVRSGAATLALLGVGA